MGFPLQNHGTSATLLINYISYTHIVHKDILSHNRIIKYIRDDDQIVTSEIQGWCDNITSQIKILPW